MRQVKLKIHSEIGRSKSRNGNPWNGRRGAVNCARPMDKRKREAISGEMPFGLKQRGLFAFILNPSNIFKGLLHRD